MRTILCVVLLGIFSMSLSAQDGTVPVAPKVGEAAPDISVDTWINTPSFRTFDELKGQVIVVKAWGIN